ncbi:MAG: hypothetical protein P1U46_02735 [Patescibacteria group bacterium]|nr:hypothetical protein [Patescibacteria group bacterium]
MECFRSSKKINSNEIIDNLLSDSTINLDKFSSWKNFKFENN